jgi:hypothetical protein
MGENIAKLIGFIIAIGGMVLFIRLFYSKPLGRLVKGNWSDLYARYPAGEVSDAGQLASGFIGGAVYGESLIINFRPHGVYLLPAIRFRDRPLLIPYAAFRPDAALQTRRMGFRTFVVFQVDGVDLWLDESSARQVLARQTPLVP